MTEQLAASPRSADFPDLRVTRSRRNVAWERHWRARRGRRAVRLPLLRQVRPPRHHGAGADRAHPRLDVEPARRVRRARLRRAAGVLRARRVLRADPGDARHHALVRPGDRRDRRGRVRAAAVVAGRPAAARLLRHRDLGARLDGHAGHRADQPPSAAARASRCLACRACSLRCSPPTPTGPRWPVAVLAIGGVYLLLRSKVGLVLTAIRDDERAARGPPACGSAWPGCSSSSPPPPGAARRAACSPSSSSRRCPARQAACSPCRQWTAEMAFAVIIGGIGTIEGPILGTIVYMVLQQTLQSYNAWYLHHPGRRGHHDRAVRAARAVGHGGRPVQHPAVARSAPNGGHPGPAAWRLRVVHAAP